MRPGRAVTEVTKSWARPHRAGEFGAQGRCTQRALDVRHGPPLNFAVLAFATERVQPL